MHAEKQSSVGAIDHSQHLALASDNPTQINQLRPHNTENIVAALVLNRMSIESQEDRISLGMTFWTGVFYQDKILNSPLRLLARTIRKFRSSKGLNNIIITTHTTVVWETVPERTRQSSEGLLFATEAFKIETASLSHCFVVGMGVCVLSNLIGFKLNALFLFTILIFWGAQSLIRRPK